MTGEFVMALTRELYSKETELRLHGLHVMFRSEIVTNEAADEVACVLCGSTPTQAQNLSVNALRCICQALQEHVPSISEEAFFAAIQGDHEALEILRAELGL